MPIILDQSIFRDDSEWRVKIDAQYHDNISPGQARNFFENYPSKRLPEYLKEDIQGQLFDDFNRCPDEYYKSDCFFLDAAKAAGTAKIILAVPDLFQQVSMIDLIKIVFLFPEETTQLFLKNFLKYGSIDDVVDFISKKNEDRFVQKKVLRFVLENPRLYKMLKKKCLDYFVGGSRSSRGSGDSNKSYNTKGDMIEIILEYAKKDSVFRRKLNSSQLSCWASYVGCRSYCESTYYIATIFECPELLKIFSGEDLARLFCSREVGQYVDLEILKKENLFNKFIEASTTTLKKVLEKSTYKKLKELNELIQSELIRREDKLSLRSTNETKNGLLIPSWIFTAMTEKETELEMKNSQHKMPVNFNRTLRN